MAAKVGFVGLGKMGSPMVRRLIAAGHEVLVFNRSRPAVDLAVTQGARAAAAARQVAEQSDVVLTALPTPESVEQVYAELAAGARPGQLFADHSTVSVAQSRRNGELLSARGASFLDAPVSGGPAGAQAGTLTAMVGGAQADLDRAGPVFAAFAKNIRRCGPLGAGTAVKLVNQLLVGVHLNAIAEAAVFGASLGADPQVLLEVIGTSFGGSTMMTRNLPRFISRDFNLATSIRLLVKDLGLIHDEAKRSNAVLLFGALAEQRLIEAAARGLADDDMAAVVKLWEEPAGLTVDKPRK